MLHYNIMLHNFSFIKSMIFVFDEKNLKLLFIIDLFENANPF